jgi:hypothetical protein
MLRFFRINLTFLKVFQSHWHSDFVNILIKLLNHEQKKRKLEKRICSNLNFEDV